MLNLAMRVEGISKKYQIGRRRHHYDGLKDLFGDGLKSLFKAQSAKQLQSDDGFWALRDVSFDIKAGEVVGIIGRNGSGKSTLLKILSRITEPTHGHASIKGRIGSLLEVGTGFQPELTGRENIYLSGAILGMRKKEIDSKLDEIVAFSGVEKFIDTPVKRYSSGMYVRLGFAVAAHLEPEILLVDEVLAVGDSQFQKKCLSKMQDVGKQGRTVLFVSHSMPTITRLCPRAILLSEGRILLDGPSHQVVSAYLHSGFGSSAVREWPDASMAPSGDVARLRAVRIKTEAGKVADALDIRDPFAVEMEYEVVKPGFVLLPHLGFVNEEGDYVFITLDLDPQWRGRPRPAGRYISSAWVPGNFLAEGTLFVQCYCMTLGPDTVQFYVPDVVAFQVVDSLDGDSARGDYAGDMPGAVRPLLKWTTQFVSDVDPTTVPHAERRRRNPFSA
jgi:lipopolysaccharide transport system ATP-binding protein